MKERKEFVIKYEREIIDHFDWRDFLDTPEEMPAGLASTLDKLAELINDKKDPDSVEFINSVNDGSLRQPVLTMIGYYRDILKPEERKELSEAAEKCGFRGRPRKK